MNNLERMTQGAGESLHALDWCERAADLGNTEAMLHLGRLAADAGDHDALAWWKQAVIHARTDTTFKLGNLVGQINTGAETRFSWKRAVEYLDGNTTSHLGHLGWGANNEAEAQFWQEKAAAHGDTGAMLHLGLQSFDADDHEQARTWWEKAAAHGHTGAMMRLGLLAKKMGDAQRQFWAKKIGDAQARFWWEQAAEHGNAEARAALERLSAGTDTENTTTADPKSVTGESFRDTGSDTANENTTTQRDLLNDEAPEQVPHYTSGSPPVAKRAGDPAYLNQLMAARYEPHVAPFNRYIDKLRTEHGKWLPYVAPTYGGTNARVLSLFQDLGPEPKARDGEGMLSVENPDETTARYLALLTGAGIDVSDTLSWNSYPWYVDGSPTDDELNAALPALKHIIELMPKLKIVILHGVSARKAWEKLARKHPEITGRLRRIRTHHPSLREVEGKPQHERAQYVQKLSDDFARAKSLLQRCG